ncbi:uncharacterized protein N7469_001265 [Penicillium citrinum]|uniref:Uncharacterized protein n=2 Tax=Penicillium TaxID=5073 RepID=A0A9W9PH92_PENCI|nr:uncharacterized protein N7469_001265 [Penicillium citrinum]KAJ5242938.1 hypothetical protein N7469_001265 [Penicillium citrinum]KAJ5599555.1 hypothetical protein N7450_000622 [Penicillium hetheringtonii]
MGLLDEFRFRSSILATTSEDIVTNEKSAGEDFAKDARQYSFFSPWLNGVIHADSLPFLQSLCDPFNRLLETGMHSGLWWLHVTSPANEDIEMLSRLLDIHPLTTEDIKMREEREKIEHFGPYYFISLRLPRDQEASAGDRDSSTNFYGIVFNEGILSFTFHNTPHPAHVWNRIKEHQSHLSLTSDWICYALMYEPPPLQFQMNSLGIYLHFTSDDIVDSFAPLIDRITTSVEVTEDTLSVTQPDDIGLALQNIHKYRKEVTHIRHLLNDKTDVIRCFARHCSSFGAAPSDVASYLSDIQDHVLTMMSHLSNAEQMLSRSQTKFMSRISFDSTRMRNQIADTLSRLTAIGSVVVLMQVTTTSFGMNVQVPGEEVSNLVWWFGILGFEIVLAVLLLFILKKARII